MRGEDVEVLQRIMFPEGPDVSGLYLKSQEPLLPLHGETAPCLLLQSGQTVSADTFFNSYYQQYYSAHTNVRQASLHLRLNGKVEISLVRTRFNNTRQVISSKKFENASRDSLVTLDIPFAEDGRVFFEITALSETEFWGGFIGTRQPGRVVRLAVIITNYRRDEFVVANLRRLSGDPLLEGVLDYYVIDNGSTLTQEAFGATPVTLVQNPNTGGAGGFSRGMMEALNDARASHLLVMDDDVVVLGETVLRTLAFLRQAGDKTAIAGSMQDMEKPHFLHEAGARWNWGLDVDRPSPFRMMALKHKVYLQHPSSLDYLLFEEPVDYGAFWFFAFPAAMAASHGLCLPLFVLGDDIEFGLRFTRAFGGTIVPLPGISVRHVPFYSKATMLSVYFLHRNHATISAIHDGYDGPAMAGRLLKDAFKHLCAFNYANLYWQARGVEDFLKGPLSLDETNIAALREEDAAFTRKWNLAARRGAPDTSKRPFDTEPSLSLTSRILRALTLGGHLVPRVLLSKKPSHYLSPRVGQWRANFGHIVCHSLDRELYSCQEIRMRRILGFKLFARSLACVWRLAWNWNAIRRVLRHQARELASPSSWCERFGLEASPVDRNSQRP